MTTTTCWSVVFSSPFSLPPWSANAWQKSNCSTGPGGKVTGKIPISDSPKAAWKTSAQWEMAEDRACRRAQVKVQQGPYGTAGVREQWGRVMKGGISKGFICLFFNLFCKHKEYFFFVPCHLMSNTLIKINLDLTTKKKKFGNSYTYASEIIFFHSVGKL